MTKTAAEMRLQKVTDQEYPDHLFALQTIAMHTQANM